MTTKIFHHVFERILAVSEEDTEFVLRGAGKVPWSEFLLNPRRLRGSDFLMRWSQGVWSEERLVQAVNETGMYIALPYGPSGTAPDNDIREFELYFERLENAGLGKMKRPDLLIFRAQDKNIIDEIISSLNGISELPFTPEADPRMEKLLSHAIIAVECENSLWRAKQMPVYGATLTPQKRLGGQLGLKKTAVLPTIIIKEEDRAPLRKWQDDHKIHIHIWHAFFDEAYGITLDKAEQLFSSGAIEATRQVFQAPGGATTEKLIFKIYYQHAYHVATSVEEPQLIADSITDKNGHILPYVRFDGGKSKLSPDTIKVLNISKQNNA